MGHEDNGISQLLAVGMILMALYHLLQAKGPAINLDSIEIFKVEPVQAVKPIVATVQATVQPEPEPEVKRNHNGYTELQQDCFDSLKTLGIKGVRERKFIVSDTFNKHDPTSVQEFLKLALGK
jgi:hypothetical protein